MPDLVTFGRTCPDMIVQSRTNRKLIICTLRHCRFGACRITVLAAVDSGPVLRSLEMN